MTLTVNIQEAKTNLSRLMQRAASGEPVIITKAGKPLVKLVPLDQPQDVKRLGFMAGQFAIPADFDWMGQDEIEAMFAMGK
jgi:prevent-host-death family protein